MRFRNPILVAILAAALGAIPAKAEQVVRYGISTQGWGAWLGL